MGKFVRTAFVATAMLLLLVPVSVFGQRYGEDLCVDLLTNDTATTDNGLEGDEWEDQPNSRLKNSVSQTSTCWMLSRWTKGHHIWTG